MTHKKYRWSKVYESAEEELVELLQIKGITATRHEIDSYETLALPARSTPITIWGAEGTAIFMIDDTRISMQPGDTVDIPVEASCTITTTFSTFAWYESLKV